MLASCILARSETLSFSLPVICKSNSLFKTEFWLLPIVTPRLILPEVVKPSKGVKVLVILGCLSCTSLSTFAVLSTITLLSNCW